MMQPNTMVNAIDRRILDMSPPKSRVVVLTQPCLRLQLNSGEADLSSPCPYKNSAFFVYRFNARGNISVGGKGTASTRLLGSPPTRQKRPSETILAVFTPSYRRLSAISPVTRCAVEANDPVRWMQGFSLDSFPNFMDRNNGCTHCIILDCPQSMSDPARPLRRTASPIFCRTGWSHPKLILTGPALSFSASVQKT